jgi:hypothetical protein
MVCRRQPPKRVLRDLVVLGEASAGKGGQRSCWELPAVRGVEVGGRRRCSPLRLPPT